MLYPVYVHQGDDNHAHGVTIPDFPGCFSAADNWDDLPYRIQEAVELYCDGEDMTIPPPSSLEALQSDKQYQDGIWMMVNIDVDRLETKPVRLNISLPSNLVQQIDHWAKDHAMTRSGFLAQAARESMSGK